MSHDVCAKLMGLQNKCSQRSFHDLSAIKDDNGNVLGYLVDSEKDAYDFDEYAKYFSKKHNLGTADKKKTLCSTDAIYLKPMKDKVLFIEFKDDNVGSVQGMSRFMFNGRKDTRTRRNYEVIIYRKFTETFLMLITDGLLEFDDGKTSISCLLVLSKKNGLSKMADLTRGPFQILTPLKGALFKSLFVISGNTFDYLCTQGDI